MIGDALQSVGWHIVLLHHKHRFVGLWTFAFGLLLQLLEAFAKKVALLPSHADIYRSVSLVLLGGYRREKFTKKWNVST